MEEDPTIGITLVDFGKHMRSRPAMYLGEQNALGFTGAFQMMLAGLVRNSSKAIPVLTISILDETTFHLQGKLSIDLDDVAKGIPNGSDFRSFVGFQMLSALSKACDWAYSRAGVQSAYSTRNGETVDARLDPGKCEGFVLAWTNDPAFIDQPFDYERLQQCAREVAIMFPGSKVILQDRRTEVHQQRFFHFPNSIFDIMDRLPGHPYGESYRIDVDEAKDENQYWIAFRIDQGHKHRLIPRRKVYCNDEALKEPGSIESGIFSGIRAGAQRFFSEIRTRPWKPHGKSRLKDCVLFRAKATVPDASYHGSTRWKLDTPKAQKEIKAIVTEAVYRYLSADRERAWKLVRFLGEFSDSES